MSSLITVLKIETYCTHSFHLQRVCICIRTTYWHKRNIIGHLISTWILIKVLQINAINKILHVYSFIHSGYFYIASSSPLLLRGAPDTARILCRSFTLKRNRQLWVKDLHKVPKWRLEQDSNPRLLRRKPPNLPMSHHAQKRLYLTTEYQSIALSNWEQCRLLS